jgi:hypothetical protein
MGRKVIGVARFTSEGTLQLSEAAKERLQDILAQSPGSQGFELQEEDGTLVLEPVDTAGLPHYELSRQDLETVIAQVREQMKEYETRPPSPDDELFPGLTWGAYLALSEQEREQFWDELGADAPQIENLQVVEVKADARIPSRQKRRP